MVHRITVQIGYWLIAVLEQNEGYLQGDTSRRWSLHSKPPFDTEAKVAFWNMGLILKQNFCFDVKGRLRALDQSNVSPCSFNLLIG